MLKKNILDCSWEEFEELIKEAIGSDFIWKIRPRDTEANRQATWMFNNEGPNAVTPRRSGDISGERARADLETLQTYLEERWSYLKLKRREWSDFMHHFSEWERWNGLDV